jgi:hypothetical protein
MKPSIHVHALLHGYCCQNQITIRIEVITEEINSLYGTKKHNFHTLSTLDRVEFF